MRTPRGKFAAHCLEWARDQAQLHTRLVPGDQLPTDGPDVVHFDGYTMSQTRSGTYGYLGLVVFVIAWLSIVISDRLHLSAVGQVIAGWINGSLLLLGGLSWLAAWISHRRARASVRAIVELGDGEVSEDELRRLRPDGGRRLWVFSSRGFEPSAIAFALVAGIRCLTPSGAAFVDTETRAPVPTSSVAQSPRARRR